MVFSKYMEVGGLIRAGVEFYVCLHLGPVAEC